MTTAKKKVAALCKEIYSFGFTQIVIDLVQETMEGLVGIETTPTRGEIGGAACQCSRLLTVMDAKFVKDRDLLKRLDEALKEWEADIEFTNTLLGLPKES